MSPAREDHRLHRLLSADQKPCGFRPSLPGEDVHQPYCWLPAGHLPDRHWFVCESDHDFATTSQDADKLIAENSNVTVFQKWTCGGCGRRLMGSDPNVFTVTGQCQHCGAVTDIQLAGCNFLLALQLDRRKP